MGGLFPFLLLLALLPTLVSGKQLVRQFSGAESFLNKRLNVDSHGPSYIPPPRQGTPIIGSLRVFGILYMTYQFLLICTCMIRIYIYHDLGQEQDNDIQILNISKNTQREKDQNKQKRKQSRKDMRKARRKEMKVEGTQDDEEIEVEVPVTVTAKGPTNEEKSARDEMTEFTQLTGEVSDGIGKSSILTKKPSMNNRSSRLPRAKKGHQTALIDQMEEIILNETEDSNKDKDKEKGGEERKKSAEKQKKTENGSKTESSKKLTKKSTSLEGTQDSQREKTTTYREGEKAYLIADPPKCSISQNGGVSKHKLKNAGKARAVFMIKPSDANQYTVSPACGFVDPKGHTEIDISRTAGSEKDDKIVIFFKTTAAEATDAKAAFEKPGPAKSITITMSAN